MKQFSLCALFIILFSGAALAQDFRIGVVNSEVVISSYPEFRRAEEQLAREVDGWRSERGIWEEGMMKMQEQIRKLDEQLGGPLSETGKAKIRMQIDSLSFVYNEKLNSQAAMEQERFNLRRTELFAEVLEGVNKEIEELGEMSDFDLIIDAANGSIVYAREPEDLTDQLLRKLEDK